MQGTNGQLMVMAAHSYCLGRQSYIVGSCIDWIYAWRDEFEDNTINVILRDTIDAIDQNLAGSEYDKESWMELVNKLWPELKSSQRSWLTGAVKNKEGLISQL